MLAQYAYAHFSQSGLRKRSPFDWGNFIAPIFLSPIVFVPLFESLKSAPQAHATTMSLLVAFENGFFFKNFIDHRERAQRRVRCLCPFLLLLSLASPAKGSECEYVQGATCTKFLAYPQMVHYSKTRVDSRLLWKKLFNIDPPPFNHSVALLVGMGNYESLNKLPFVYNDIRDMRDYLLNEEEFNDVYILQDRDVDANSLRRLIVNDFSGKLLASDDRFLFYYSGHGSPEADGNGHMLLWGEKSGIYDPVWDLPVSEIKLWSARLPAKHALFLLDGCGLGLGLPEKSASGDQMSMISKNGSRTVLAATRGDENSYGTIDGTHSLFTSELLKVLRSGDADPKSYGFTTIDTVSGLLQTNLARALQGSLIAGHFNPVTPESLDSNRNGQFIFFTASRRYGVSNPERATRADGLFEPKDGGSSAMPLTNPSVAAPPTTGPSVKRPPDTDETTAKRLSLTGTAVADLKDVSQVFDAGFSPDGTQIITISQAGVSVWDASNFRLLYFLKNSGAAGTYSYSYSPDALRLVTCGADTVYVWSAKSGRPLDKFAIQEHAQNLTAQFSPDGTQVLIQITNLKHKPQFEFKVWGAVSPFIEFALPPAGSVSDIRFVGYSNDGTRLLSTGYDSAAHSYHIGIWDSKRGVLLDTVPLPKDDYYAWFLRGQTRMISFGNNGGHIVDYLTKQVVASIASCPGFARLSPDAKSIVRLCWITPGNSAQIWDSERGSLKATLMHNAYIRDAQFSSDSKRLVTASFDLTARIWDVETGNLLATLLHDGEVHTATFSPDGRRILTTGADNVAHVFELTVSQ